MISSQNMKNLIPFPLRDLLRPTYQKIGQRWAENRWSPKPNGWRNARSQAYRVEDLDNLLQIARSEFGITQIRSEITGLLERLQQIKPRTVVEIGTHKGGNSFLFCHALPTVQRVIGVDLCVQNAPKLIYFTKPGQVYRALHGDSQTTRMKRLVKKHLASHLVDFLFIDGDHSYKGVKADFELYAPLVRPGGIIALHDIVSDYTTRYGRKTHCYAGEVYQLWSELKQIYPFEELIDDVNQDGFGIGLIKVPVGGIRLEKNG